MSVVDDERELRSGHVMSHHSKKRLKHVWTVDEEEKVAALFSLSHSLPLSLC